MFRPLTQQRYSPLNKKHAQQKVKVHPFQPMPQGLLEALDSINDNDPAAKAAAMTQAKELLIAMWGYLDARNPRWILIQDYHTFAMLLDLSIYGGRFTSFPDRSTILLAGSTAAYPAYQPIKFPQGHDVTLAYTSGHHTYSAKYALTRLEQLSQLWIGWYQKHPTPHIPHPTSHTPQP